MEQWLEAPVTESEPISPLFEELVWIYHDVYHASYALKRTTAGHDEVALALNCLKRCEARLAGLLLK